MNFDSLTQRKEISAPIETRKCNFFQEIMPQPVVKGSYTSHNGNTTVIGNLTLFPRYCKNVAYLHNKYKIRSDNFSHKERTYYNTSAITLCFRQDIDRSPSHLPVASPSEELPANNAQQWQQQSFPRNIGRST